jgi:hypothetical protein
LHVIAGPAAGRKIHLASGQTAQFGSTEWADFSFPRDTAMADQHFAFACTPQGCAVRDLKSAAGTLVNGEKTTEAIVRTGDQITAGNTTFVVQINGEPLPAASAFVPPATKAAGTPGSPAKAAAAPPPAPAADSAVDLCQKLKLDDAARELLVPGQTPLQFFDLLVSKKLYPDAVRVIASLLPPQVAVAWGCRTVRAVFGDSMPAKEVPPLETAEQWVTEPSEENRRAAQAQAEGTGFEGITSWLSAAAFWSGGSMSPPGAPEVPPPPGLVAQALTGAMMLLVVHDGPKQAMARYQALLQDARAAAAPPAASK